MFLNNLMSMKLLYLFGVDLKIGWVLILIKFLWKWKGNICLVSVNGLILYIDYWYFVKIFFEMLKVFNVILLKYL